MIKGSNTTACRLCVDLQAACKSDIMMEEFLSGCSVCPDAQRPLLAKSANYYPISVSQGLGAAEAHALGNILMKSI